MSTRIESHPILGDLGAQKAVHIRFNGTKYRAFEGDTIASALMANGIRSLRRHELSGSSRGIYCNIGHCFECRVQVEGQVVRACLTTVADGMMIETVESGRSGGAGK